MRHAAGLILLCLAARAQVADDAARELAREIAALLAPREVITLSVRNVSSEPGDPRPALERELRARGFRLDDSAGRPVRVTLSESWSSRLWIAEIEREVAIVTRLRPPARRESTPGLAVEAKLLWEQDAPILDVTATPDGLLVLDALAVSLAGKQSRPLARPRPWPRDLRGRLALEGDSFRAHLPGVLCAGTTRPELSIQCGESDEPWPAGPSKASFAADRNFFTRLEAAPNAPPFFSAAAAGRAWIFAGLDGQARLDGEPLEIAAGDVASVDSGCGSRRQVLIANDTAIQAFEAAEGRLEPAGAPLEFMGPITALWAAGPQATAVVRHSQRYAAYSVKVVCGP